MDIGQHGITHTALAVSEPLKVSLIVYRVYKGGYRGVFVRASR